MVTTSLPFVANSGMTSATLAAGSSRPSPITSQRGRGHDRLGAGEDDVAGVVGGVAERVEGGEPPVPGDGELAGREQARVDLPSRPVEELGQALRVDAELAGLDYVAGIEHA